MVNKELLSKNALRAAIDLSASAWNYPSQPTSSLLIADFQDFQFSIRSLTERQYYEDHTEYYLDVYEKGNLLVSTPQRESSNVESLYQSVLKKKSNIKRRKIADSVAVSLGKLENALNIA